MREPEPLGTIVLNRWAAGLGATVESGDIDEVD